MQCLKKSLIWQNLSLTLPWTLLLTSLCFTDVSPGGRGINGNPIIVLPEFPAFGELREEEVQNVFGYLTSIPGLASDTHTHTQHSLYSCSLFDNKQNWDRRISGPVIPSRASRCQHNTKGLTGSERNLGHQEIIEGINKTKWKIAPKGTVTIK